MWGKILKTVVSVVKNVGKTLNKAAKIGGAVRHPIRAAKNYTKQKVIRRTLEKEGMQLLEEKGLKDQALKAIETKRKVGRISRIVRHPIRSALRALKGEAKDELIKKPIEAYEKEEHQKELQEKKEERQQKRKEEEPFRLVVQNLKRKMYLRMRSAGASNMGHNSEKDMDSLEDQERAVKKSYDKLITIIDMAVKKNGYRATAIALKNWEGDFENEIIRLEAAIYDAEYAKWGGGSSQYEFRLRKLAEALKLDKEDFTGGYEAFIMDF